MQAQYIIESWPSVCNHRTTFAAWFTQVHYLQQSRDLSHVLWWCLYFVCWFTLFSVYTCRPTMLMLPVAFEAFCVPRCRDNNFFPVINTRWMNVRPFSSNTSLSWQQPLQSTSHGAFGDAQCSALSLWSTSCHTHKCLHLSVCSWCLMTWRDDWNFVVYLACHDGLMLARWQKTVVLFPCRSTCFMLQ